MFMIIYIEQYIYICINIIENQEKRNEVDKKKSMYTYYY